MPSPPKSSESVSPKRAWREGGGQPWARQRHGTRTSMRAISEPVSGGETQSRHAVICRAPVRDLLRFYHHQCSEVGGVIELARFPIRHSNAAV